MGADYKSLIRIRQWALDEERRQLGQLNAAMNTIEREIEQLRINYEREQQAAAEADFIAASGFGNYTEGMIKRREQLQTAKALLEVQIEGKTEEVREAFQELKKYELAQEALEEREAAEAARRENIELDDIAIEGHTRKNS